MGSEGVQRFLRSCSCVPHTSPHALVSRTQPCDGCSALSSFAIASARCCGVQHLVRDHQKDIIGVVSRTPSLPSAHATRSRAVRDAQSYTSGFALRLCYTPVTDRTLLYTIMCT